MQQFHIPDEPPFDRARLLDAVHYICSRCSREELGNVKLHKILYFADMLHFTSTGRPLTGVPYRKQSFGPVATHLTWATSQLARDGKIRVDRRDYYGFNKLDYVCVQPPKLDKLSNYAIQLLNDVIEFVCARSAKEISELSHNAAWDVVKMGDPIPYYSAFGMYPAAVSEADIKAAASEASRIRRDIEAEANARGIF